MTSQITRGMILAAGLGTRLRPLTNKTPKPLLEVGDRKIIEYTLELLAKSGIKEVVINLHHLGNQIEESLGTGAKYGIKIYYSKEPKILGTGGGIKKVENFFNKEAFVVINGDVIIDVDLKEVLELHMKRDVEATLVLRTLGEGEKYTPVRVDGDFLMEFGSGDVMYTGVQVVSPSVLGLLRPNVFSDIVTDGYIPLLKRGGKIGAYIYDGFWSDVGTLDRLESTRRLIREDKIGFWYL